MLLQKVSKQEEPSKPEPEPEAEPEPVAEEEAEAVTMVRPHSRDRKVTFKLEPEVQEHAETEYTVRRTKRVTKRTVARKHKGAEAVRRTFGPLIRFPNCYYGRIPHHFTVHLKLSLHS
jgi:hypothetical protein